MDVHLVDGTYELFRHFFAIPPRPNSQGLDVAATVGVLNSLAGMLESGVTHLGVATDHVIESFRNDLWPGYKTGVGVDPRLLKQFPVLEEAVAAAGVVVWPMTDLEADDALAAAAEQSSVDPAVGHVYICTPDKDLAQCVRDDRVVQLDRRKRLVTDEDGVVRKFGVRPQSIPDYLALVGDAADGFPGLPGWGPTSAAAVLARYEHLESIPPDASAWDLDLRGTIKLASTLAARRDLAYLFRDLATLRTDVRLLEAAEDLRWSGPTPELRSVCAFLDASPLCERFARIADSRLE